MKSMQTLAVLRRRFDAAWLYYLDQRTAGEIDLALASLRRWSRLRAALESSVIPAAPADSPAPVVHRRDDGGALVSVPIPGGIRRDLEAHPWRLHLDAQVGRAFAGIPAGPDLYARGRALSPLADFGRQRLEQIHLSLGPAAWHSYQMAADGSGIPAPRLLAAVLLYCWSGAGTTARPARSRAA